MIIRNLFVLALATGALRHMLEYVGRMNCLSLEVHFQVKAVLKILGL